MKMGCGNESWNCADEVVGEGRGDDMRFIPTHLPTSFSPPSRNHSSTTTPGPHHHHPIIRPPHRVRLTDATMPARELKCVENRL